MSYTILLACVVAGWALLRTIASAEQTRRVATPAPAPDAAPPADGHA